MYETMANLINSQVKTSVKLYWHHMFSCNDSETPQLRSQISTLTFHQYLIGLIFLNLPKYKGYAFVSTGGIIVKPALNNKMQMASISLIAFIWF